MKQKLKEGLIDLVVFSAGITLLHPFFDKVDSTYLSSLTSMENISHGLTCGAIYAIGRGTFTAYRSYRDNKRDELNL